MAVCSYCATTILFGGIADGGKRYCHDRCRQSALLLQMAEKMPYRMVVRKMKEFHQGRCPKCGGPGPVDVHRTHRICSGLLASLDFHGQPFA